MENSQTQVVSNFELKYKRYCNSYQQLISSNWEEKQHWYEEFEKDTSLAIKSYLELIRELKLDYLEILKSELDDLFSTECTSQIDFSEEFIALYKKDLTKYFFLMFLIIEENPKEDISEELVKISEYVFDKEDWQNRIIYVVEGLGLYGNPLGLSVIEEILERVKQEGVHDEEIGNHILVYLLELPVDSSLSFLQKNSDYPVREINKHFSFLRKKISEV